MVITALALLMSAVFGCSGSGPSSVPSDKKWVEQGGGFYSGQRGKAFYGVGAATNQQNVQLRRVTAETNARTDIARTFKTKISDLIKIYNRTIQGGNNLDQQSNEAFAQQATVAFTEMDLSFATIVDSYYDANEKTFYSLACLDLEAFKKSLDGVKNLSKQYQEQIKANADSAFDELSKYSGQ